MDIESMVYVKSESEFDNARMKGFLERVFGMFTGHDLYLLSFSEVVEKLRLKQSIFLGLKDVPVKNIIGSTGRYEDFTRRFLPRSSDKRDKERWRNIYTLAVTGKGFPPIDVYKIDQVYFVKDGNHRVSVARDLGWETIQAYVTELPSAISLSPDVQLKDLIIKEECAYFLEKTQLDVSRPDSRQSINFSEPGGYQRLLRHIELHRYRIRRATGNNGVITVPEAAADWYDNMFIPIIDAVKQMKVIEHFPGRSESDLYMWLVHHQGEIQERHQLQQAAVPETVRDFLDYIDE